MSSSFEYVCGCAACPTGIGLEYIAVIAGVENDPMYCQFCEGFNTSYMLVIPSPDIGPCGRQAPSATCIGSFCQLVFNIGSDGKTEAQLTFLTGTGFSFAMSDLPDCKKPFKPPLASPSFELCDTTHATASVTMVPLSPAVFKDATCIPNSVKVCMQNCVPAPYTGAPTECCQPSQGCDDNGPPCNCDTPVNPTTYTAYNGCDGCYIVSACPPGSYSPPPNPPGSPPPPPCGGGGVGGGSKKSGGTCTGQPNAMPKALYSKNALYDLQDRLNALQNLVTPVLPGVYQSMGQINAQNGNVAIQIVLPDAGPHAPNPFLTYSSNRALQTEYGYACAAIATGG